MKKPALLLFWIGILLAGCGLSLNTFSVEAADSSTVNATVTLENISVSVADGTVEYGVMSFNSSKGTISSQLNDPQTATNNGNIQVDFNIRGQNSDDWALASSAGADQYVHRFCDTSCDTPPTNFTALSTDYQTLEEEVDETDTHTFHLHLTTPTSSSSFDEQEVHVVVQAIAS